MTEQLRVVIADDHAPTRFGVRAALEAAGWEVVGEASDALKAVAVALEIEPDVCVLDIHMPGHGIRAAEQITRALPATAVVMLTASRDDDDLFDALRAGVAGFLPKDINPDRLSHALRGVLAGEAAIPRALVARIVAEFAVRSHRRQQLARSGVDLTAREWEVLELLREASTTAEIAARLGISPTTVRRHVSAILQKVGARDRATAVRMLDEHYATR